MWFVAAIRAVRVIKCQPGTHDEVLDCCALPASAMTLVPSIVVGADALAGDQRARHSANAASCGGDGEMGHFSLLRQRPRTGECNTVPCLA
jgi:hypothetical protein